MTETTNNGRGLNLSLALLEQGNRLPKVLRKRLGGEDDDTIQVPRWVLQKLKVPEGDPLCLVFNLDVSEKLQERTDQSRGVPSVERIVLTFLGNHPISGGDAKKASSDHLG